MNRDVLAWMVFAILLLLFVIGVAQVLLAVAT